jgi:hypothetical protein
MSGGLIRLKQICRAMPRTSPHAENTSGILKIMLSLVLGEPMKFDELVEKVSSELKETIKLLTLQKKTLQLQLLIEVNITQGGLGDVYVSSNVKKKM